ncbi:hypothetical protein OC25_08270 [Pedobacter kyungheensis]|uniref:Uncharacterized protein n=1 Tax=Pedobacter kyungheensis TaxID=1069985 RepID=A0A0C1G478_9SPHI|nr:hypothetical protein [Pedobacter kyungheensis]KIA94919.1 hypothetical protein OC25_08270 [Pedobacter kyungheensis]
MKQTENHEQLSALHISHKQHWILKFTKTWIVLALGLIMGGLFLNHIYEMSHQIYYLFGCHFLIILGEAIFVMFTLHLLVEKRNHDYSYFLLQEQSKNFNGEFNSLIKEFKQETKETLEDLKVNGIFTAILREKLPHQIVEKMISSKFLNAAILRERLKLTFDFLRIEGDNIIFNQRMDFDLRYISGSKSHYEYDLYLKLSKTPVAEYKFKEAGHGSNNDWNKLFYKGDGSGGIKKESGDVYKMATPALIAKNEKISFYQILEASYNIAGEGTIDNYFSNLHTIDMAIEINNFPEAYSFMVYPTFPRTNFNPRTSGTKISYDLIEFLVPGQGFSFSISKK